MTVLYLTVSRGREHIAHGKDAAKRERKRKIPQNVGNVNHPIEVFAVTSSKERLTGASCGRGIHVDHYRKVIGERTEQQRKTERGKEKITRNWGRRCEAVVGKGTGDGGEDVSKTNQETWKVG